MLYSSIALTLGCLLLYQGGNWLLDGVTAMGERAGWPKAITGLLLVSLGTSAPELFVSVASAVQGHGGLAAGNVVGSNIINSAVVLGIAASVVALNVERLLQKQLLFMFGLSALGFALLMDGTVSRLDGLLLLAVMSISFVFAFKGTSTENGSAVDTAQTESPVQTTADNSLKIPILLTIAGILLLLAGAELLIWGGLRVADYFKVPEAIVALTVTAVGTSLPEIAATVAATVRREVSLAVGNVVGSNLLNVGLVLGLSALVVPLENINLGLISPIFFLLLALALTVFGFRPGHYPRWFGMAAIASYVFYVVLLLANV